MANLKQSKKRARQDAKKSILNKSKLSMMKTYIKKFKKLIDEKNFNVALSKFSSLVSVIDKNAAKKIIKKKKSR